MGTTKQEKPVKTLTNIKSLWPDGLTERTFTARVFSRPDDGYSRFDVELEQTNGPDIGPEINTQAAKEAFHEYIGLKVHDDAKIPHTISEDFLFEPPPSHLDVQVTTVTYVKNEELPEDELDLNPSFNVVGTCNGRPFAANVCVELDGRDADWVPEYGLARAVELDCDAAQTVYDAIYANVDYKRIAAAM